MPVVARFDTRRFLRDAGVPAEQIDAADEGGWLILLALDRLVLPGPRAYTRHEAAQAAGVPQEMAVRFWRAMGFPDAPDGVPLFTASDVAALRLASLLVEREGEVERVLQIARVVATSMNRIAELLTDEVMRAYEDRAEAGETDVDELTAEVVERLDLTTLPTIFDYVHRRQLHTSLWRRFGWMLGGAEPGDEGVVVGFADLVGYTSLSQQLSGQELRDLVARFDDLTHDVITRGGGRVVKRIGDAVMFMVDHPENAVAIGLEMIDELEEAGLPLRIGMAMGPVVTREGDCFGPVVNLASRIVTIARPQTMVVSEEIHDAIEDDDELRLRSLGRRRIKDMGLQRLFAVRRHDD